MSLKDGIYTITTSSGGHLVGRHWVEDKSLLPKRVVTLHSVGYTQPKWDVHAVGNGNYKIKTGGSYVGVMPDGHVFAFLLEDMIQGSEWKIQHVPQHGDNAYIITKGDGSEGWTYKDKDRSQACRLFTELLGFHTDSDVV
ncbi:hypothetical protein L227DRAFT_134503 [Lentinus tigrinus ALCF2SS1-6]|uniref:Uncharacterized protein n=1 Tax=Lentinus tigrinus ALCF2SS1-6 TaxID=1328759 RepID=A0A5C2SS30_9APHY|nr:hypothetical protein L227DRAFT_134503 [Lentinus tigrinus ALCF2SS1-6]